MVHLGSSKPTARKGLMSRYFATILVAAIGAVALDAGPAHAIG